MMLYRSEVCTTDLSLHESRAPLMLCAGPAEKARLQYRIGPFT
jgi:hypothetical protein